MNRMSKDRLGKELWPTFLLLVVDVTNATLPRLGGMVKPPAFFADSEMQSQRGAQAHDPLGGRRGHLNHQRA